MSFIKGLSRFASSTNDTVGLRVEPALGAVGSSLKISDASPDAVSAEALTTTLTKDAALLSTGAQNINDSSDLYSRANDATNALYNIIYEIAADADTASNLVTSQEQRDALDEEAQNKITEYNRIVGEASYNGSALINGSNSTAVTHGGNGSASLPLPSLYQSFTSSSTSVDLTSATAAATTYSSALTALTTINTRDTEIEAVGRRLEGWGSLNEKSYTAILRSTDAYSSPEEARKAADSLSDSIKLDPGVALAAQSKLNAETVYGLLGI